MSCNTQASNTLCAGNYVGKMSCYDEETLFQKSFSPLAFFYFVSRSKDQQPVRSSLHFVVGRSTVNKYRVILAGALWPVRGSNSRPSRY